MTVDIPPNFPKVLANAQRLPAETANHGPLLRMTGYQLVSQNGRLHERAHAIQRNSVGPLQGALSSLQVLINYSVYCHSQEKGTNRVTYRGGITEKHVYERRSTRTAYQMHAACGLV